MAKRFQFRLQPVLRHRERQEEKEMLAFAAAQDKVVRQQEHLDELAEEKSLDQDAIVDLYQNRAPFGDVMRYHQHINLLNMTAAQGRVELRRREQELESRREDLLKARTARRALELLKERQREAYRQREAQEEARFLDELSVQQYRVRED
jgi:flagellar FliJ protein